MDEDLDRLLADLRADDHRVRDRATRECWQRWFMQKGMYGLARLQRAQDYLDQGDLNAAEQILSEVIQAQPDFAEAWNRRAVLYYLKGDFDQALADCHAALHLVPHHFGALHGLGLCYLALGQYREAIGAFRRALDVQPHAIVNQRLMLECTAKLS